MADRELTAEEIAASVAHSRAEADAAIAAAEKSRAEARKANAEAEKAEVESREAIRLEKKKLAGDEHHHTYYFKGGVDDASVKSCLDQLNVWRRNDPKPSKIEIVFFSPGGSVFAGMVLFDHIIAMRNEGWHFTTVTRGYAASMGGILLQAGDERVCGPESYILIHEISSGAVGKIGELEDEIEFIKIIQKRVNDIFVARSGGKVTASKLRAMYRRKDFWMDSSRALALGIIDKIG